MHLRLRLISIAALVAALLVGLEPAGGTPAVRATGAVSPFGMNLYLTGLERSDAERAVLLDRAREAGVRWSREELSWANIQPGGKVEGWKGYDDRLQMLHDAGIQVVGMLLTTPDWASGHSQSEAGWYWYPPTDPKTYGAFVEAAVRRWHDKVGVWELWNEPDKDGTWLPHADPAAYAALLYQGYTAVKRADPDARVMVGSVFVHDQNNEGLAFLEKVVAASGGHLNFDMLGIHTFMNDRQPEDTSPVTVVQNLPWRLTQARAWLARHGRGDMPVWITEDGQSVCNPCNNNGTDEATQATRLVRRYMLALENGAEHFDYFQMKDKFNNGPDNVWGSMSVLRNDLSPRPAFYAYKTMAGLLGEGQYAGIGPLQHSVPNRWQPEFDRYQALFTTPGGTVNVLWTPEGVPPQTVELTVGTPNSRILSLDGSSTEVVAAGGHVQVRVTSSPVFVVKEATGEALDPALDARSPTGFRVSSRFSGFWQAHGGLAAFGYPITGERLEVSQTDGKFYVVQWFERTRFEWHPENRPPFDVLLGLLGRQVTAGRVFPTVAAFAGTPDRRYVPETGHSLSGRFLEYWRTTGGIAVYGYPISEPFTEVSPTDGKPYTVQYFERTRFELHPENRPPFDLLLGLLGRQLWRVVGG
ncbi:MAG: hypothetical protein ACR2M0_01755 [Chloroflexia bacterium]